MYIYSICSFKSIYIYMVINMGENVCICIKFWQKNIFMRILFFNKIKKLFLILLKNLNACIYIFVQTIMNKWTIKTVLSDKDELSWKNNL